MTHDAGGPATHAVGDDITNVRRMHHMHASMHDVITLKHTVTNTDLCHRRRRQSTSELGTAHTGPAHQLIAHCSHASF